MTKKSGILTSLAVAAAISTAPVNAETTNQITKQKIEHITCSTRLACDKLSYSIQSQIDELKSRGFRNLSREEKIKYGNLKKELIALERQETKTERQETKAEIEETKAERQETKAERQETKAKRQETKQNSELIKAQNTAIMAQLSSIKGSLLSK